MDKQKNLKDLKEAIKDGRVDVETIAKNIKMSPSKKRILGMSKDKLLQYNSLIFHKGCQSLSSAERRMVQERIAYGINKGSITTQEVADEINALNAFMHGELTKAINDNSSTKE